MMKKIFEILTAITLLIWGGMFLYLFFSNRVDDYLTSSFRIFVPIAGIGMLALGIFNLLHVNRSTGVCNHKHAHGDDHQHQYDHLHQAHAHDEASATSHGFAFVVLLVPLLIAPDYSQDKFSGDYTRKWIQIESDMQLMGQRKSASENSNNRAEDPALSVATFTLDDLKKIVPQTTAGDFLLDLPNIFYSAGDQELMSVMEKLPIETTVQVIEETLDGAPENRLRAYRLLLDCCAADARPLSVPIEFSESLPDYVEMGWYKINGHLKYQRGGDYEYTPILQVNQFEATSEPADWMMMY